MFDLIWLIPVLPLLSAAILMVAGPRRWRLGVALLGCGSVGLSALITGAIAWTFKPQPFPQTQTLWTWLRVGDFAPGVTFRLDALSLTMALVVTGVGFLIHLYSVRFMAGDEGYRRFFAYMNLFVGSMLILVLADNLLLLYLGWEGVGLCSYLLIGFWYREAANARAAVKAFLLTRVGDAALAVALLVIYSHLGTLDIQEVARRAIQDWPVGSPLALAAAALLLAGAVGKSAQLPLQTWLPDAMAGPTPVSALIHAATMVTAGVYLIARMNVLLTLAPPIMALVAIIGAVTLLLGACSALVQTDLKRVLAYSTMSQVGYMFLALGVGAWSAAIFHFVTHAFFKSLLFLAAGVVIMALGEEHDIRKMGGLRRRLPLVFWTFLIGAASLATVPFVTAGFYSKRMILDPALLSILGGPWLLVAGVLGELLTAIYAFRVVFVVFFGQEQREPTPPRGLSLGLPLVVLAIFALVGGGLSWPDLQSGYPTLPAWVQGAGGPLTDYFLSVGDLGELLFPFLGIFLAWLFWVRKPAWSQRLAEARAVDAVRRFWLAGWGFDWLYDSLFVRPYVWLARLDRGDVVDYLYRFLAWVAADLHQTLRLSQTGRLRWYAGGLVLGALILLLLVVSH
jgi:NADH-quinone oxidoreductase subunit L